MVKKDDQNNTNETSLTEKLKKAKEDAAKKDKKEAEKIADSSTNPQLSEIENLKKELAEMTELAKRTMADLQNYKRRQSDERIQIITMANIDLIRSLIPILDNLERAKLHAPEAAKEWFSGIEMCITQLKKVLEDSGLKQIESIGKTFNPDLHEALMQGPGEKNIIIEELEKGYVLGDRVIKHAKVKVGNGEKPEIK